MKQHRHRFTTVEDELILKTVRLSKTKTEAYNKCALIIGTSPSSIMGRYKYALKDNINPTPTTPVIEEKHSFFKTLWNILVGKI